MWNFRTPAVRKWFTVVGSKFNWLLRFELRWIKYCNEVHNLGDIMHRLCQKCPISHSRSPQSFLSLSGPAPSRLNPCRPSTPWRSLDHSLPSLFVLNLPLHNWRRQLSRDLISQISSSTARRRPIAAAASLWSSLPSSTSSLPPSGFRQHPHEHVAGPTSSLPSSRAHHHRFEIIPALTRSPPPWRAPKARYLDLIALTDSFWSESDLINLTAAL